MRERVILGTFLSAACLVLGCASSESGSSPGGCQSIAGTWGVSGACGSDTCLVTQNGCGTNFSCTGAVAYVGSVDGAAVSYSGKNRAGMDGSCSGTVSGNTMTGTCTLVGVPGSCAFTATRK